ncbi:hypothetical protein N7G274_008121 [Stereocaulon virgatum]|uniref:Uncharacterized protein n=1 Tax=Stereocaulon virgatum TaxID=373712 RepID=A0ABR3ZZF5_9LECA
MCLGVLHIHSGCLHEKKFELLEPCATYSEEEKRCTLPCTVVHTVRLPTPKLCITCFRRVEDDIFDRSNSAIQAVEADINRVNELLKGRIPQQTREDLEDHRDKLEEEIAVFKQLRKEEIDEFRAQQGVFADG